MQIKIESENVFDEKEMNQLKELFEVEDDQLLEVLQKVTLAALSEYKQMFLGIGLSSRADEILQYRLYHLIEHYFGEIPYDEQVSSMFQMTQGKSRNLIRSVVTRFHYNFEEIINENLKSIIITGYLEDEKYHLVIQSNYALEQLNRIIGRKSPKLDQLKRFNMSRTYTLTKSSYKTLCDYFKITRVLEL